jgi:PAS domain-containing protein
MELGAAALYSCNASGVITYCNQQAINLWGRAPAPGDTDEKFCGPIMRYRANGKCPPFDRGPVADVLGGKSAGIYDAEACVKRPDGTHIRVSLSVVPILDDQGSILGSVSTFSEIPQSNLG